MKKRIISLGLSAILASSAIFWLNQPKNDDKLIKLINQEMLRAPSSSGKSVFNWLDATQFTDSMYPWLGYPVLIISESQLLGGPEYRNMPPDEIKIKQALIKFRDQKRIILNITSWQVTKDEDESLIALHINWYLQLIRWAKEILPETDIGVLGIPDSPWLAIKSTNPLEMLHYQHINKLLRPLINELDTLYPLFQVFSHNLEDLSYLMGAQLYIAKTSGKPIYPIVSHRNMGNINHQYELLPIEVIRQQCLFVRENAEGMVWWSTENEVWDNSWYDLVSKQCFL